MYSSLDYKLLYYKLCSLDYKHYSLGQNNAQDYNVYSLKDYKVYSLRKKETDIQMKVGLFGK